VLTTVKLTEWIRYSELVQVSGGRANLHIYGSETAFRTKTNIGRDLYYVHLSQLDLWIVVVCHCLNLTWVTGCLALATVNNIRAISEKSWCCKGGDVIWI